MLRLMTRTGRWWRRRRGRWWQCLNFRHFGRGWLTIIAWRVTNQKVCSSRGTSRTSVSERLLPVRRVATRLSVVLIEAKKVRTLWVISPYKQNKRSAALLLTIRSVRPDRGRASTLAVGSLKTIPGDGYCHRRNFSVIAIDREISTFLPELDSG